MNVPSHPCWAGAVSKGARLICVSATFLHVKSEKSGWLISDPGWKFIYFLHILNEHMMMTHVNNPCFTSELGAGYCGSPQKWSVLSASHLFPTECQFPSHLWIFGAPVPLSASPLLSACILPLLYLHIFPVAGYRTLLRYLVCSRLNRNSEEHWNKYDLIIESLVQNGQM